MLQCFSIKNVLQEHKETCMKINGKQTIKLKSGSINFKDYLKQLAAHLRFKLILNPFLKKLIVVIIIIIIIIITVHTMIFVLMIDLAS